MTSQISSIENKILCLWHYITYIMYIYIYILWAYPKHLLLHAVVECNGLFEFPWAFSHPQKLCMMSSGFSSSNCPKFTNIFPLLLILDAYLTFLNIPTCHLCKIMKDTCTVKSKHLDQIHKTNKKYSCNS